MWRKWEDQERLTLASAPTCHFVKVLVVDDDAFAHLLEIHAVQVCGHSIPGGPDRVGRDIFLLFPWVTESQLDKEAVCTAARSVKLWYL